MKQPTIQELNEAIEQIRARNRSVERSKAWETSWTLLLSRTVITYITMGLIFSVLGSMRPHLDAIIPTAGYFLSSLSLPFIKKFWERAQNGMSSSSNDADDAFDAN